MIKIKIIKSVIYLTVLIIGSSSFVLSVSAAPIVNPVSDAFRDFPSAIATVTGYIRPAAVLAYVGMLFYGGFLRETAGGDAEKAKKAINVIIYSTTGFVLILMAPLIVATITALFGADPVITP